MRRSSRLVDALLGVVYVGLTLALVGVAVLVYNKAFTSTVDVTLEAGSIGNALQEGSDVKLHGVPVGRVSGVEPAPDGATVSLALEPEAAEGIPAETVARLLPKTLFGERYVALVAPEGAGGETLQAGDTIHQDASTEAIELAELLDEMLPVLKAIQPEKLSAMLGEMAIALRGQGERIGDSMSAWAGHLEDLNPLVPTMTDDLAKLADVARSYDAAAPDLLQALESMTVTSQTFAEQRTQLSEVYANVISASGTTNAWMSEHQDTIIVLAEESRAALDAVRPYASQFPCLFEAAADFIPVMDETLGKGTDEPGIHVRLNVVESRGKYLPGRDAPTYRTQGEPRCPYVTGQTGTRPAAARTGGAGPATIPPPPSDIISEQVAAVAGLGAANSPGENQLIAELVAPTQEMAPAEFPEWNSLLLGPTLRDTKVTLR